MAQQVGRGEASGRIFYLACPDFSESCGHMHYLGMGYCISH